MPDRAKQQRQPGEENYGVKKRNNKGKRKTPHRERCLKDWSRCPRPHGNGCHVFAGEQARAPACNQSHSEKQASGESKDLKALLTSHIRHHIFKVQRPWTDCSTAQHFTRLRAANATCGVGIKADGLRGAKPVGRVTRQNHKRHFMSPLPSNFYLPNSFQFRHKQPYKKVIRIRLINFHFNDIISLWEKVSCVCAQQRFKRSPTTAALFTTRCSHPTPLWSRS